MAKQSPMLRFDQREIAVVFSLFIFVALLMFTVGIVVGKGITTAKYESMILHGTKTAENSEGEEEQAEEHHGAAQEHGSHGSNEHGAAVKETAPHAEAKPQGTSVSTKVAEKEDEEENEEPETELSHHAKKTDAHKAHASAETPHKTAKAHESATDTQHAAVTRPALELMPEKTAASLARQPSLLEPARKEANEAILNNPKIRSLLDESGEPRKPASVEPAGKVAVEKSPLRLPPSFPKGKFSVQVGSFPAEQDAKKKVEDLKTFGFPFAYYSVKQLGDAQNPWYRVWLGYYPDFDSARKSGEYLQQKQEVKNFLVRKSD